MGQLQTGQCQGTLDRARPAGARSHPRGSLAGFPLGVRLSCEQPLLWCLFLEGKRPGLGLFHPSQEALGRKREGCLNDAWGVLILEGALRLCHRDLFLPLGFGDPHSLF